MARLLAEVRNSEERLIERIFECELCGAEVVITPRQFTATCDCGADYNLSGDRLASRSQWGEETGESPSDCY